MANTKTKTKSDKKAQALRLQEPAVASRNPWRRFAKGADLELAISRGREEEALWILADGAAPPMNLLADALCSAAYQGMASLCSELGRRGAYISHWPPSPTLWSDLEDASARRVQERSYPPASLALLGGHVSLAKSLEKTHGEEAFGNRAFNALFYGVLASKTRGGQKNKQDVLSFARERMSPKELALAANLLSLEGAIDEALDVLESSSPLEQAKIARSMLAPLAGYAPSDARRELAWIALERAVELCENGQALSCALKSPFDHQHANVEAYSSAYKRQGAVQDIANECFEWGHLGSRWTRGKMEPCWPRVAAVMAGNGRALSIMSDLPWSSDEIFSIKKTCEQVLAIKEMTLDLASMPHFFTKKAASASRGGMNAAGIEWARAGLALVESKEIQAIIKAGEKKIQKERRREARGMSEEERAQAEAAAAPKPRRSSRL